jgi:hypothetical protein
MLLPSETLAKSPSGCSQTISRSRRHHRPLTPISVSTAAPSISLLSHLLYHVLAHPPDKVLLLLFLQSTAPVLDWISLPRIGTSARNFEDSSAPRASRPCHQTHLDALNLLVRMPFPRSPRARRSPPCSTQHNRTPNLQPPLLVSTGSKGSISAHCRPCRLNLNTIIAFSELKDRQNCLAVGL